MTAMGHDDDFGHQVRRRPAAVYRPASTVELAALVTGAGALGGSVVARGAGHSTHGQAQSAGGLVADLRALDAVLEVGADRVVVQAGARWSAVLAATLPHGLTPPVLTNYLELTVGGTLAAGGFGGTAHRYGPQVDSVLGLDVVTGDGTVRSCVPGDDLGRAMLGGLGLCGVIATATLRLVPAPERVRRYLLPVADLPALTRAHRALVADGRFEYVEGQYDAARRAYLLDVAAFYRAPDEPDDAALLAGLPGMPEVTDQSYAEFAHRMAAGEAAYRDSGEWYHPHPALNLLVPDAAADALLAEATTELIPADVGPSGVVLIYPVRPGTGPLPRVPAGDLAFFFGLLRTAPPDPVAAGELVAANDKLYRRARALGATVYPVGSLPMDGEDWTGHFGAAWPELVAAKARYDPGGVLGSGHGVEFPA